MCSSSPQSEDNDVVIKPTFRDKERTRGLNDIEMDIQKCRKDYKRSFWEIGRLLIEAKAFFGKHGEWLNWLRENVDMSITTAQRLMKVYQVFSQKSIGASLDFTKLYLLTKLPKTEIDDFMQQKHNVGDNRMLTVEEMSRRELEVVIRNYLRGAEDSQILTKNAQDDNADIIKDAFSIMEKLVKLLDNSDLKCDDDTVNNLQRLCTEIIQKL